jgi:hypothetical protein
VGNDTSAAGFSFSFGGDSQAYFAAVVAEFGAGGGFLFRCSIKVAKPIIKLQCEEPFYSLSPENETFFLSNNK